MKITRDFQRGTFVGKAGEALTQDQMADLGRDTLEQLRDVAGVLEGDVPEGIATGSGATQAGAITADQAEAEGTLTSAMADTTNADPSASASASVDGASGAASKPKKSAS
jgi:hypothetical protein